MSRAARPPNLPHNVQDFSTRNSIIRNKGDFNSNNTLNNNITNFNFTVPNSKDSDEAGNIKETLESIEKLLEPRLSRYARLTRIDKLAVCYPGTRQDILRQIEFWISGNQADEQCLCIVGVPGSGKSTIAATVARRLLDESRVLSAEFFIRREIAETADQNNILPTIAQQLAQLCPSMASIIQKALLQRPTLVYPSSNSQIDEIFLAPLRAISDVVVVIIDALDELADPALFARFLAYIIPNLPSNARLLLTTRNEHDILVHLDRLITKISLELRVNDSVEDVKRYITEKLRENLQLRFMDDEDWRDWPSPEQIQALSDHASGLFVWGATAVGHITQFVYDEGISGRDEVLAEVNSMGMEDLNALYGFILRRLLPRSNPSAKLEHIRRIIGLLIVAQIPMNLGEVCIFLGITPRQFDAKHFLQRARSVLLPGTGRVDDTAVPQLHKSFIDFITSPRAEEFQVHEPYHHGQALHCALKSMEALHFNMCNLESSYLLNNQVKDLEQRLLQIPSHIRYSCHHWSQHLLLMGREEVSLLAELKDFMENQFLFWLEVLSVSGSISTGTQSMKILGEWLTVS
ncbi:hypothetical protein C8J56DRAFT_856501 [Mycena floridula]|nr:hypothetical protein C8J56DRAFT_856501 [Mycena floridula]